MCFSDTGHESLLREEPRLGQLIQAFGSAIRSSVPSQRAPECYRHLPFTANLPFRLGTHNNALLRTGWKGDIFPRWFFQLVPTSASWEQNPLLSGLDKIRVVACRFWEQMFCKKGEYKILIIILSPRNTLKWRFILVAEYCCYVRGEVWWPKFESWLLRCDLSCVI